MSEEPRVRRGRPRLHPPEPEPLINRDTLFISVDGVCVNCGVNGLLIPLVVGPDGMWHIFVEDDEEGLTCPECGALDSVVPEEKLPVCDDWEL